jgi:DNA polymerase-3 subunit delta'
MSFQDIKGNAESIRLLRAAVEENRLASAYLFIGPEGVGKDLVATTLVKVLNCQNRPATESDCCDRCVSCLKIEKGIHPDLHRIPVAGGDGDSIKIEQIRELKDKICLKPYEGRYKAFIINGAEKLTPEAANAFLKILEEPPGESLIILTASREQLIFATVRSRLTKLRFYPMPREDLEQLLRTQYSVDYVLSHYLAYASEGRLGEALRRLKQEAYLREKNNIIDEIIQSRRFSLRWEKISKEDLRQRLDIWLSWFRDIYLAKVSLAQKEFVNIDRKDELFREKDRYSFPELEAIFNDILKAAVCLKQNINPNILMSNLRQRLNRG